MRTYCQVGFNLSYDLNQLYTGFASIEISNDTLVIYGNSIIDSVSNQPGMCFVKLDTLGNIITYHIYHDSLGDSFTVPSPNSFIKLADSSGYVAVGQFFQRENGYFAKFDNSGFLVGFKEFFDSVYSDNIFKQIIEVSNGFLIGGTEFKPSSSIEVFLQKVDSEGELVWKKRYGSDNKRDLFGSIFQTDENEIVIGASTTSVDGVPLPQTRNTSKIFAIDSLGNVKWEWENQPSLEEFGVGRLYKTPEGNWAYTSARGWYNATYNEISRQPKFIIRDKNFNIIKEDTFGIADHTVFGFSNLIEMSSGGWFAIGVRPVYYPLPPIPVWYNSFSGWMVRLNNQAEQIWSRVDTAFWSTETGSTNYLYDAVELPSGSIIVCGFSRTYEPTPKDWGWLIKVSKDGCIDTLNCTSLNTTNNSILKNKINIYPNPTQSIINIESMGIDVWDKIDIINVVGQTMKVLNNTRERKIDLTGLEDGIYFIRLTKSNHSMTKKIIKRR